MDIALCRVSTVIYMVLLRAQNNQQVVKVRAIDSGLIVLSEVLSAIDLHALIPIVIGNGLG